MMLASVNEIAARLVQWKVLGLGKLEQTIGVALYVIHWRQTLTFALQFI